MLLLEHLMRRLPDATDTDLLEQLLAEAGDFIMAYTGRAEVPEALLTAQVMLACAYFNRMGTEGESRREEGGISRALEALPGEVAAMLGPWRLAKAVR